MNGRPPLAFDGWIAGASFASGDAFVLGMWLRSPFGAFADLMWSRPDGTSLLQAPREDIASCVGSLYRFDEVLVTGISVLRRGGGISVAGRGVSMDLVRAPRGAASRVLALRPHRLRTVRWWIGVEDRLLRPLASKLVGDVRDLRTSGVTATGAREWYAIHDVRRLRGATAAVEGRDLGPAARRQRRAGFGFSEFPADGGLVRVTSLVEDLDGAGARP